VISLTIPVHSVNSNQFNFGIFLALASSLFIGTSFILKKKGLIKLTLYHGAIRAGLSLEIMIHSIIILLI
jgi:hypothetical protein